ncbi:MAG: alpha/beta hydrolase, partial [Oscillospiraceae bacterium]
MNIKEGYIDFKGCKTYYRIAGECTGGKLPLLALHGGPGCAHDYLESLDGIAEKYGRAVVYYD